MMSLNSVLQKERRVQQESREAVNKDGKCDREWQAAPKTAVIIPNSQDRPIHLQT